MCVERLFFSRSSRIAEHKLMRAAVHSAQPSATRSRTGERGPASPALVSSFPSLAPKTDAPSPAFTYGSVISAQPALSYSSVISTITLWSVTTGDFADSTFVQWTGQFSSDAGASPSVPSLSLA